MWRSNCLNDLFDYARPGITADSFHTHLFSHYHIITHRRGNCLNIHSKDHQSVWGFLFGFLGLLSFFLFPLLFFSFSPWSTNILMLPRSYVRPPTSGLRSQDLRQEKLPVLMEQKIVEHYFPSLLDTWWECRDWQMRAASLLEQRGSKVIHFNFFKNPPSAPPK